VLDAAALSQQLPAAPDLVDLGSGAGFPGLPLAVLWPASEVLLIEARERRHHFQRAAIRALGLRNASALRGRAESLPPEPRTVVIAQAMAQPARALRWMLRWARLDGWLVIPGGEEAPRIEPLPEVAFERVAPYSVPGGGPHRTLWIGRRVR
jgi:16S rRNA (guanine527-N7)-methyltransferase